MRPEQLADRFAERFGAPPRGIHRAPGRVNLIGEHTDYNDGLVMPMAIDRACWVAAGTGSPGRIRVCSLNLDDEVVIDLGSTATSRAEPTPSGRWSDYPIGVALSLERAGVTVPGADLMLWSDVPLGSGLSSSAALEVATATALLALAGESLAPLDVARACQAAETEFVGARCGLMDQYVSVFGRAGHALVLDCRSLVARAVALPRDLRIVVCNSMVKHAIASGEYNRRRSECEEGVRLLAAALERSGASRRAITALRDVTLSDLEAHRGLLTDVVYRRCRHVITENDRVRAAAGALEQGDLASLGKLLAGSHASLAQDFEVSCTELDLLVEIAGRAPGLVAARMTGGGFGGCTVNLVGSDRVDEFRTSVAAEYEKMTGMRPDTWICAAADGAARLR